ncbi:hypothetical protein AWW68_18890 [Roseivirga spongicola]|uniref:Uncharacterized protein n=1 Tax=Roseivirga spongicola TaxID=333140 RepID=A0A150XDY3_9BACT|nr:hypothetical protein [Roseivirga spongicola]KYG76925.1 hypothetical protein AWW68_18890 [Roseivirga spongicola]
MNKVKVIEDKEVNFLAVDAGVRYWEDATVNGVEDVDGTLIPLRRGDRWRPIIDLSTGIIKDWEIGKKASVHYKVCDDGSYYLLDKDEKVVTSIKNNYVPSLLCPHENGYGDYIIMDINENGSIEGFSVDLEGFNETPELE